jgi:hypothetical protein
VAGMDGWMNGWMDGWMDGRTDGWVWQAYIYIWTRFLAWHNDKNERKISIPLSIHSFIHSLLPSSLLITYSWFVQSFALASTWVVVCLRQVGALFRPPLSFLHGCCCCFPPPTLNCHPPPTRIAIILISCLGHDSITHIGTMVKKSLNPIQIISTYYKYPNV